MISVKGGTQTWSNSVQRADFKSDGAQNLSATDKNKALGGEDSIGDVLNKVADPNYVDAAKKPRAVGNSELGKDAFMTLLLTQMKNQDPTNPLKSHEMAAQLAQFTSLEKLNNINDGIASLHKDAQPEHNFQALSFIGKTISTDNSKVSRIDKESHHEIRFTLPADAQTMAMQIKDSDGKVVRTIEQKNMKAGKNEVSWNGLNDDGAPCVPGEYTAAFEATGSNGHKLHVETKTEGVITGVNFTPAGPQLMVGKQVVAMSEVKSISQPGAGEPAQAQPLSVPAIPGSGGGAQPNSQRMMVPPGAGAQGQPGGPQAANAGGGGMPPGAAQQIQRQLAAMAQQQAAAQQAGAQGAEAGVGAAGAGENSPEKMMAAMAGKMFPIGQGDSVRPKGPKNAEVKPELKANAAKAAKLSKGNINDAAMASGLINKLNKDGAKAGMGST